MQIHPRIKNTEIGEPYINDPDRADSFGVLPIGDIDLYVTTEAEAEKLIRAGFQLKDQLHEYHERHPQRAGTDAS